MAKKDDLYKKIKECNVKLQEHMREVDYWMKELHLFNLELAVELKWEQDQAAKKVSEN